MMILRLLLACLLLAVSVPTVASEPEPVEALTVYEAELLARLNAHRARFNLAPLKIDWEVQRSARRWAETMARSCSMRHSSFGWENVAYGQRDPAGVTTTWINSSGHNANMLSRRATHVGLSGYRASSGAIYWVQQFRSSRQ